MDITKTIIEYFDCEYGIECLDPIINYLCKDTDTWDMIENTGSTVSLVDLRLIKNHSTSGHNFEIPGNLLLEIFEGGRCHSCRRDCDCGIQEILDEGLKDVLAGIVVDMAEAAYEYITDNFRFGLHTPLKLQNGSTVSIWIKNPLEYEFRSVAQDKLLDLGIFDDYDYNYSEGYYLLGESRALQFLLKYTRLNKDKLLLHIAKQVMPKVGNVKIARMLGLELTKQTIGKHITEVEKMIEDFEDSK